MYACNAVILLNTSGLVVGTIVRRVDDLNLPS
jgi:hypothetical protein